MDVKKPHPKEAPKKPAPRAEQHSAVTGHGPPEDVPATELAAALQVMPFPHKVVDYPRKIPGTESPIGKLAIIPATILQKVHAQAAAHLFAKKVLADPEKAAADQEVRISAEEVVSEGYQGIYKTAVSIELLFRTCRVHDKLGESVFPGARWMRKYMTDDEVGVLISKWLRVQLEIGPIVHMMSDAECDLWIEKLIEGGSSDPLGSLASDAKTDLILRLASLLRKSRTDRTSSGEPRGGGSTGTTGSENPSEPHEDPVEVSLEDPPVVEAPEEDPYASEE